MQNLAFRFRNFAICRLYHAHMRKDTRLSELFRTASDEKLGGACCILSILCVCLIFLDLVPCSIALFFPPRLADLYTCATVRFLMPLNQCCMAVNLCCYILYHVVMIVMMQFVSVWEKACSRNWRTSSCSWYVCNLCRYSSAVAGSLNPRMHAVVLQLVVLWARDLQVLCLT